MQASLSMRLFRSTGQQAMQAISANVGQTIGQILTFQTKVASLKGVFQSVGSAIVSTLQQVVAQLIKAVAQAAILAAVMAAIPGFGQASFASNFGNVIGGIMPFAEGGIVTGPTVGLVGEAGPEAVIPLDRMGEMGGQQGGDLSAQISMDELIFQMDKKLQSQGYSGLYG
jgi:phage-related minor tail protein